MNWPIQLPGNKATRTTKQMTDAMKLTRKIVSGLTASEQKTFADVIEKILKKI